jgi:lantibiotic modifying enzyme
MPSASSPAWSPLLDGDDAVRAAAAVTAIAEGIAAAPEPVHRPVALLAGGDAGIALFFHALDRARPGQGYGPLAEQHLERAIDCLADGPQLPSLYSGFTGVAWVAEHLQNPTPGDGDDPSADIDEALHRHLAQSPWRHDYDLTTGLVGFGVYALEREPRPAAVGCLERVVARLEELAEPRPQGLTWHTRPELLPEESRASLPRGADNLGVAHGVPGVIGLLARLAAAGVATATVDRLLAGAVPWLLAQKLPAGERSIFPFVVGEQVHGRPARTAWCYGDPGIAAVLLAAARAAGRPDWEAEALALARAVARRPPEQCAIQDSALCHGAAGLAHLCNRLYQATGDPELRDAARRWFRQTLDDRRPGEGIGGYLAWAPADGDTDRMTWVADPGFLTGAAGIGLALLAATTAIEPVWDRLLLASPLPPSPERP